ncbi:MAG: DUF1624 domain-containing protein [Ignavibacteria bacterium]|nr:MAG: DUF1624 domain-containing protein [Ignavibacteria bacterium]
MLVMIETHVVNALLFASLKDETPFKVLTFVNGLVAPSFLFCAGFGLAISLRRRWAEFVGFGKPLWRYLFRLAFIMVVAYSLHLPFFSLRRMRGLTESQWIPFFQVDILQVIVVTLLFLILLACAVRNRSVFRSAALLVALAVVCLTPIVNGMDFSQLPIWLRPYLSAQYRSQFPLFPWSAFLISGTVVGFYFMDASDWQAIWMKWFACSAAAGIALSLLAEALPVNLYPNHNFWHGSPDFFFVRLGLIGLPLAGLWYYERGKRGSAFSLVALFGRESLLVYVLHLLVVYGYTYEWSFVRLFGPTLSYPECLGLFAALTISMYIVAYVWHRLKGWNMRAAQAVEVAALGSIVAAFILK